ncbi:MAG: hypothetical protein ACK4ZU_14950 [Allorhizobium sp.]
MELRLSEFADAIGTEPTRVRNAIHYNRLPFLDVGRKNEETTQKVERRTYSAADGFAWFLHDEAARILGCMPSQMAGLIQSNWPRGLSIYTRERLRGEPSDDTYLIIAQFPLKDDTGAHQVFVLPRQFHRDGKDHDNLLDIINDYPFVSLIRLDPIFEAYILKLAANGWTADDNGFSPIAGGE